MDKFTARLNNYKMTIGIECHVQLATETKLFSLASNDARDEESNSVVDIRDYGLPGVLPILNQRAVELAVIAGKALNAKVANISRFDRKHYFYPDLPKGYQTTQMYQPIIIGGSIELHLSDGTSTTVRIHHAHIEEDAGKLSHFDSYSLVDLNRAGSPLIEIVSEPDISSAQEARAFAVELHRLMTFSGVSYGDLYNGNMRFDVNISVAEIGATELGRRVEVKNLNSFRSVERAAEFEFRRQIEVIESGGTVTQETRGWLDDKEVTLSQRSKEDAQDYRYMPDPDIPPLELTDSYIESIQARLGLMPGEMRTILNEAELDFSLIEIALGISDPSARDLIVGVANSVEARLKKRILNWLIIDIQGKVSAGELTWICDNLAIDNMVELADMAEKAEISSNSAIEILFSMLESGANPRDIANSKNLIQLSDLAEIEAIVDEVLGDSSSEASIRDIRAGKDKAIGFLVGQVMKRSRGKANPSVAQQLIRDKI